MKTFKIVLAALTAIFAFTACGGDEDTTDTAGGDTAAVQVIQDAFFA